MGMPKILKNFATFVDGTSYVGEVTEVVLPKLTRILEGYRAGGMRSEAKVDHGYEALEAEITAAGWLQGVLKQWGGGVSSVPLRFAGAVQSDDDAEYTSVEVEMRGRWEEIDPGSAKAGEGTEFKCKLAVTYYKLTINGEEIIELDSINMIEKVGGTDMLETVRQILGI